MIQPQRIKILNRTPPCPKGRYVLYWMQASQRSQWNHALDFAICQANQLELPLVTFFGLTPRFPAGNARHYRFMLEGLQEVERSLKKRRIRFIVGKTSPEFGVEALSKHAAMVVTDRGYLNIQRFWRQWAAENCQCRVVQVESDAIVPIETASTKEEYSAATLRRKINAKLQDFLVPCHQQEVRHNSLSLELPSVNRLDLHNLETLLRALDIDRQIPPSPLFKGGSAAALQRLLHFLDNHIDHYPDTRNDPNRDSVSHLSPYLHFGQISPLHIALETKKRGSPGEGAFLEELIVRRELGMNFVFYNRDYDSFACLPEWAQKTLKRHQQDPRTAVYSPFQLERAQTHDPYWNAAQLEMVHTGKMHGYMRMYWGKKILEWVKTPEVAFSYALYLNNKYELDGRDPSSFTGVAWCFGKHDRPWAERAIFGKVRYMNARGLERKFSIGEYVSRVNSYA